MNSCSLLIPCYNAEHYLPRLWETVKAQTVPFDEIICYDDGSKDDTAEVAKSLGAKVIVGGENMGVSHARNQLAKASSCEWIHFHDADDLLHLEYLEKAKDRIDKDTDVIICNVDWIDEQTREVIISWKYNNEEFQSNSLIAAIANPVGVINVLCRRDIFLKVCGFDESISCWEDADLYVRLAGAGARFAIIEEVLGFSLRHSRGLSYDQHRCWKCRLHFLKNYSKTYEAVVDRVIIDQLELVARNFLKLRDKRFALEALEFSQSLGGNPPLTNNALLAALKFVLPALLVIQIQQFIRKS
ncbi:glycosyltransferase family 2 protein [Pseudanabaena sp. FACHB-1998]|uniref:glycosyltransferase family 2 protein n=1 Tax=Pseudanabaena sp. FACHB-1998 TaxID=2692858 RepID=UPI0016806C8E|nr:glycosyltransferase family A protein [Pseudanabaena sp. FACHB-1998]MBD2176626.1 glycosyltransferase family 2 protein [Pseudanabaena sp. FACHB-1998]